MSADADVSEFTHGFYAGCRGYACIDHFHSPRWREGHAAGKRYAAKRGQG